MKLLVLDGNSICLLYTSYVGDTALDEASAAAAGCPFVHAAYGFGSAVAPLASVHTPGGLPAVLDAL